MQVVGNFRRVAVVATLLATLLICASAFAQNRYIQTNLVSDIPNLAAVTDPNLKNAWGLAFGPGTPFWVADNATGLSTLYAGDGTIVPLVVTIPGPPHTTDQGVPTGLVFNSSTDFAVRAHDKSGPALFIFDSEDGTISGWNPGVDLTHSIVMVNNSIEGRTAVYKGLAIGETDHGRFLYAANFHDRVVEIYDAHFKWKGNFTDDTVPPHYAPFGIHNIGGQLYVTFAEQDANGEDDLPGPGHGFVDVFDLDGNLVRRFVSRGPLNSPWGVAMAPATFGRFANKILVGNFGNGRIHAFDPATGKFVGVLRDQNGVILSIDGLWALSPGGGRGSTPEDLFFTAGPNDEADGLFGKLNPAPRQP
jgi:uncharacterized protein (TIGR03118 family)